MSVAAKKWVRKHSPTRGSRRTVLIELAWDADEEGRGAHLSTAQLADATGLSRSTIKRALAHLEAELLIVRHRGGKSHCRACGAARHGAHVFDVVVHLDELSETTDPNQMSLLGGRQMDQAMNLGQKLNLGHSDPGSWSTLDQQEEIEDVSLSLDQVESSNGFEEHRSFGEAEPEPAARKGAHARGAAPKPVTYRGRTVARSIVEQAGQLLDVFNASAGQELGARTGDGRASQALKQIVGALLERDGEPVEVWERGVRAMVADPPGWIEDRFSVGHVFGPKAAEHTLARGRMNAGAPAAQRRKGAMTAAEWDAIADELEAQEMAA